jgi:hypothetical protein
MPKKPTKKNPPKPAHPAQLPVKPNWGTLAFLHSLGIVVYIAIVAYLLQHADNWFGQMTNIWGPIAFLLLFTISAAIVGLLVFGRPVHMYLDGKKKEAFAFTFTTIGFLFVEALFMFIIMMLMNV